MSRELRSEKRKSLRFENLRLGILAEWTGLEPATPGVTGRYSNQLNYHSLVDAESLELPTYAL